MNNSTTNTTKLKPVMSLSQLDEQLKAFNEIVERAKNKRVVLSRMYLNGLMVSNEVKTIGMSEDKKIVKVQFIPKTGLRHSFFVDANYDIILAENSPYGSFEYKGTGTLKVTNDTPYHTEFIFDMLPSRAARANLTETDFTTALKEATDLLHPETCMCLDCMEERKHEFPV